MSLKSFINSRFWVLNEKPFVFLIILLVTLTYLHPMFLGKVDTPIDIRNVQMYPWRYYAVDKKIKKVVLWEHDFSKTNAFLDKETKKLVFEFKIPPDAINVLKFYPEYDNSLLDKLDRITDKHYYLTFDFKSGSYKNSGISFGVQFARKGTDKYFTSPTAIYPGVANKDFITPEWYTVYIPLNNQLNIKDLKLYQIQIVSKNPNKNSYASFYIKDLKLLCEDFSKVEKIHNYFLDDIVQGFTPAREFYSTSIKNLKLPFWNNYILTGCEYLAEHQVGYLHPLYFLSYFLFDHFTAHLFITFICFFLCGIGAYFLARYWGLSLIPSLLTSIVYMFHPFNVVWLSFEHVLMISSVLPFLIISYEKNINSQRILNKYLLISATLLGLIFLSGHLQHVYYALIFFFLYAVYRLFLTFLLKKGDHLKHIFSIVFIFSISFMMGAVVTIPLFSLVPSSHRVELSKDIIKASSVPISSFLGLFFPYYRGYPQWSFSSEATIDWGFSVSYVYFGLIPFLLTLLGLRYSFRNRLVIFFLLVITFSVLISTGSELFFLLRDYIPGFKQLQHSRFLQLYSFSVPFLAGIGFQSLIKKLSFLNRRVINIIGFFVILISIIDLIFYSSFFVTWSNRDDYKKLHKGGSLEFLIKEQEKTKDLFRVLPFTIETLQGLKLKGNVARPQTLQPYKIEEASGYVSLVSKDLYNLYVYLITKNTKDLYKREVIRLFPNPNIPYPIYNFRSKVIDLLNIRYFLVPNIVTLESDDTEKVFSGDCAIYENKNYLPRAFFIPTFKVIESSKETIVELDSEGFNPKKEVILMIQPSVIPNLIGNLDKIANNSNLDSRFRRNDIEFLKYEPENITLKVTVDMSGFLVLGHNLNSNWKVKINHKENKHFQANLIQRAVYIPKAGEYTIEFYYYPKLFFIGFGISCFAILILICLALSLKYKNRISITNKEERFNKESDKIKISI